jgi:hypothetical protein
VVNDDLDVDRAGRDFGSLKADPPLVIDTDAVLALPIAFRASSLLPGRAARSFKLIAASSRSSRDSA